MNLTELTKQLQQESKNLEVQHQQILSQVNSLIAQEKALTYQIAKKELKHEEISQALQEVNQTFLHVQSQIEIIKEESQIAHEKSNNEQKETLKERNTYFEHLCTERERSISVSEKQLTERESKLHGWEEECKLAQNKLALELTEFETGNRIFDTEQANARIFQESSRKELAAHATRLTDRENECVRKEKDIERRSIDLKEQEKKVTTMEERTAYQLQKSQQQAGKLTMLTESYDQKLSAFAKKEKLLEIRDIKLSDREAVAASAGR